MKRRKRKATSPIEGTQSSDESDNSSTESLHIKSKVAKASSRQKNKVDVEDFFEEARYFVMKSNNHENVALSKAKVNIQHSFGKYFFNCSFKIVPTSKHAFLGLC